MYDSQVTVTYRVACDHCGAPASGYQNSIPDAIAEARKAFHYSSWLHDGTCPRELWLCTTCHDKYLDPADSKRGREFL